VVKIIVIRGLFPYFYDAILSGFNIVDQQISIQIKTQKMIRRLRFIVLVIFNGLLPVGEFIVQRIICIIYLFDALPFAYFLGQQMVSVKIVLFGQVLGLR